MERPRLSRFPHHAWLGYWEHVPPAATVITTCRRQVAFSVGYMGRGHASVRWILRGRERRFDVDEGAVRLAPADGERHAFIAAHSPGNAFYVCMIPQGQLEDLAASEDVTRPGEWHHRIVTGDPGLRRCMERLSRATSADETDADEHRDEVARRLMLRLVEIQGGGVPAWRCDASVFDRRTLEDLVAYVDDHLKSGLRLADVGPLVGLSPSHFARKFRRSTGLSLHRFVNVRRVQASFTLLRANEIPLAHLSIDLGFASQSHFTRLFGELTGMSPDRYRRQFKPVAVGGVSTVRPFPPFAALRSPA